MRIKHGACTAPAPIEYCNTSFWYANRLFSVYAKYNNSPDPPIG